MAMPSFYDSFWHEFNLRRMLKSPAALVTRQLRLLPTIILPRKEGSDAVAGARIPAATSRAFRERLSGW
jgi:hypothetical protein